MRLFFLVFSVFFLAFGGVVRAQKPLFDYPLGVQTYTFRNHFPKGVEATLDSIRAMGFTEIEAGVPKGLTAEEFRRMCDARGLKIPSTGADYGELVKDPEAVAARAAVLGATYVMCAWIPHSGDNFTLENAQQAVTDFNRAGKVLKARGLTFCYHPHGYEFRPYQKGTLLDYLVKNTDPAYVSFEMDVLWTLHGGGNPVKLLRKYGSRWKLMHLKDLKKGVAGDFSGHTPAENDVVLGTGQADWKRILKAAKKAGVAHCFIEDESDREMVNVPKSAAYLKGLH